MGRVSIDNLARRLARLQDQAARRLLDQAPIEIKCYWANEDQGPREPGVTYIITDWSSGAALASERGEEEE